jgi:predicted amidohydrolase
MVEKRKWNYSETSMFSKLGLLRFVDDYGKPIEVLESAIKAHGDIGGSLIVLPEAFNIGKFYRSEGKCDYRPIVLQRLQSMAAAFDITFVAGLVLEEPDGPTPPFNSAYLISSSGSTPICRKMVNDDPENRIRNYTPCTDAYDLNNPLRCGDAWIATLICSDCARANEVDVFKRETDLAERLALKQDSLPQIVCVPACMGNGYGSEAIAEKWSNAYFILANSDKWGCTSIIAKHGNPLVLDRRGNENAIIWAAISGSVLKSHPQPT